jgi:hypothetical protein
MKKSSSRVGGVNASATKAANTVNRELTIDDPCGLEARIIALHQGRDTVGLWRTKKGRRGWGFELISNVETTEIPHYREAMCQFLSYALDFFLSEHFDAWEELVQEERAFGKARDGDDPDDAYFEALRDKLEHLANELMIHGDRLEAKRNSAGVVVARPPVQNG